jgi:hypothetical protein
MNNLRYLKDSYLRTIHAILVRWHKKKENSAFYLNERGKISRKYVKLIKKGWLEPVSMVKTEKGKLFIVRPTKYMLSLRAYTPEKRESIAH